MIFSALGITILAALGFWSVGGFLLRTGGALLILAGAVGLAIAGDPNNLLLVTLGALLWRAGHFHYALRRGVWKSALAKRAFDGLVAAWRRMGSREDPPPRSADMGTLLRRSQGCDDGKPGVNEMAKGSHDRTGKHHRGRLTTH